MYKRAAGSTDGLDALWHLDTGRTLFVGPLEYNASHQHGAPVYLAGLYGNFGLRLHGGSWLSCRTAMIPAGVKHELDIGGNPLAVFYVEAGLAGAEALAPLVRSGREEGGALVGEQGETTLLRTLYEDRGRAEWTGSALGDLLDFGRRRAARATDPRIQLALAGLSAAQTENAPVSRIADRVGLSASRFQHLFTREVGVPFRRYRAWQRMRAAIAEIVAGSSFTRAAHAAGFADQAHFAHDFRRTFGAPASRSLSNVRRPTPAR